MIYGNTIILRVLGYVAMGKWWFQLETILHNFHASHVIMPGCFDRRWRQEWKAVLNAWLNDTDKWGLELSGPLMRVAVKGSWHSPTNFSEEGFWSEGPEVSTCYRRAQGVRNAPFTQGFWGHVHVTGHCTSLHHTSTTKDLAQVLLILSETYHGDWKKEDLGPNGVSPPAW